MSTCKHCLPIIENTLKSVSGKIALYSEYDYFEVWLDYLESIDHSEITHVIKTYPNKIIFVSRRLALEPIKRDFNNRMSLLESLALEPCIFDFDIKIQQDELEYTALQGLPIKKLISYHNYQRTPDTVDLEKILLEMDTFDPTISKLACFCETALDALRLLELTYKESQRKPVIILGMGQHGLPTRIFGCEFGNEFTFSPVSRQTESAPGQLTRNEMESIVEVLRRAR